MTVMEKNSIENIKNTTKIQQIIDDMPSALLSWYSFAKKGKILYITNGATRFSGDRLVKLLTEQGREVVCADGKLIHEEKFIKENEAEFIYIISAEELEKNSDIDKTLQIWKKLLKPDGTLLLGMNNRIGLRFFCGDKDLYSGNCLDGIENYRNLRKEDWEILSGRMYARAEIDKFLEDSGFVDKRYYSVLPNLDMPQIILREDYIPNEELGIRLFPMYKNPETVYLAEEYLYTTLIENGLFHKLANAYLIECSLDSDFSKAKQITLSVDRGPEAAFATVIQEDGKVLKKCLYREGRERLSLLKDNTDDLKNHGISMIPCDLTEEGLLMPYVNCDTGAKYLRNLIFLDKNLFIQKMDEFRDLIFKSSELEEREVFVSKLLGEQKKELSDNGIDADNIGVQTCLKHGYIDLVPLNSFYLKGEFVFFDQEFCEEHLPVKVLLMRLVDLTYQGDLRMEKILPREFFLKRYKLEENLQIWRRKVSQFTKTLRNERELRSFHERHRRNEGVTNSNRQRMNFSSYEYQKIFVDIFEGLDNKKLYLFGSGNFAKQFVAYYKNDYNICGILDNDDNKWGKKLDGITITSPEVLRGLKTDEYKVIICIKNYSSVLCQLKDIGTVNYAIYDRNLDYHGKSVKRQQAVPLTTQQTVSKKYHIGYIAGVFDLYHIGHLNMFRRAKEQCDYLIVGVVTDEGVYRNKKTRPFVPFNERIELVRACKYVDEAVEIPLNYCGTRDAYRLYHFDVQFSGSDYAQNSDWLADKQYLESHGATMVFFPYTQSTSSTKLKGLINERLI